MNNQQSKNQHSLIQKKKIFKKKIGRFNPTRIIVHITVTHRNVKICYMNDSYEVLGFKSSGMLEKNSKKSSPNTAKNIGFLIGKEMLEIGIKGCYINIAGYGKCRDSAIKAIYDSGLEVYAINDDSSFAFNGTRRKSKKS